MRVVTFASGSTGNCALLSMDGVHVLLDAGISCRRIRTALRLTGLDLCDLSAVCITHEHGDHISGLATLVKSCPAPVVAPRILANRLRSTVPGADARLTELDPGEALRLGALTLRCFPTSHDVAQSVGWRVDGTGESFALATDTGVVTEAVREGLRGADVALIEANHDLLMLRTGPYPYYLKKRVLSDMGHLSNDSCAVLAAELMASGTRHIILGHLSRTNNTPELAFDTVRQVLGSAEGLYVAPAFERFTLETAAEAVLC
ncbi:MAG: MBL fold metallo-hydrolase [Oscillospiraceae bacterium]|nr:MBL fold metallo-hydrolase [Oscillospiraceae bacterium]